MDFYRKYKNWIIILAGFLAVRLIIFITFWQASADKGGWRNFYNSAQSALPALMMKFHEICDWHPLLYYFFTSIILYVFHSQWFIYLAQIILAGLALFLGYKIARLYFSEKISLIAVLILAIEPFWAWNNWLLTSENLSTPLFLLGLYFFLKCIKGDSLKNIYASAIFLGLATLTRPNTLLLPVGLSVLVILIFIWRKKIGLDILINYNFKRVLFLFAIFNLIFFAVLIPWLIYNKIAYNRFTLANILSTNVYYYNYPTLLAWQKNIPQGEAQKIIYQQADRDLGRNVGDQGDCNAFSKNEFNKQLDYYDKEAKQYILDNFPDYLKMHLFRAMPFFLQPGYSDMQLAYTGKYSKPDITMGILQGRFSEIKKFFLNVNFDLISYLIGILFWGLCSLSVFAAVVYSYFKDKDKFLFFLISLAIILYSALVVSPFVLARYRLPVYILFFIPFAYFIGLFLKQRKLAA